MTSYVPNTESERLEMLASIGKKDFDDLFSSIPKEVMMQEPLKIPEGESEITVGQDMSKLAAKNSCFRTIFRGAGAYRHFIPAVVRNVTSRNEFVTGYTPYQAEVSQGLLQIIYEYQTMICQLTGMEVSNASLYDGANAVAEAMNMCKERKRHKMLLAATANPDVLEVAATYAPSQGVEIQIVPHKDGVTDMDALKEMLDETVAGFYVPQNNYYGLLEDIVTLGELVHGAGARFVVGIDPISASIVCSAGEGGADIAVGDGQPLGLPLAFGGPYLGFIACKEKLVRRLPGRIVGETVDGDGKRGFVLTLQAREQHIRREKSTSSICSNEALCAFTASVYMATMGPDGLREVAAQCFDKAHYAAAQISAIPGFEMVFPGDFFDEFVTECPVPTEVVDRMLMEHDILGGLPIEGNRLLWCVTEVNSREEIDKLVSLLWEVRA